MPLALQTDQLSKAYKLGQFNTGALSQDLERWWALIRGKEDPFLKIGESNDRSVKGESNVVWSLRDVNLEIEQGSTLGIIGKNGAGKSTLLKVLSRVTSPSMGTVKIKGRIASLLEVGTGFHPELTGRENIFLNGAILGMRKAEIRKSFDEIVDFAGVARYVDTPVKRYSSGMYVRLAFAVAAHLESEILIVDEVLAVGDAEFQRKCLGKMGEISEREGRTILFVSHNMSSIEQLCTEAILLKNGALVEQGPVKGVVQKYIKGEEEQLVARWVPSDNDSHVTDQIELLEYALKDAKGNVVSAFNTYDEATVEVTFRVKESNLAFFPNLHFMNESDQVLFVTSVDYENAPKKTGTYSTTFQIAPKTFNVGLYKIGIAITGYPGTDVQFFVNPAVIFKVTEWDLSIRQQPYSGPYPGDFRLELAHQTIEI